MNDATVHLAPATAFFLVSHVGISSTPLRGALVRALGERPYLGLYSLVATGGGEGTSASDLDLLVEMESGRTYLDLVAFWQDVEESLGCHVDIVTDGGVSPYLRDKIYREAVPL